MTKIEVSDIEKAIMEQTLGQKIVEIEGVLVGKYAAKLKVHLKDKSKREYELSCGQLGAFDRDVHNSKDADFSTYKMNWDHMIEAALEMPNKWRTSL